LLGLLTSILRFVDKLIKGGAAAVISKNFVISVVILKCSLVDNSTKFVLKFLDRCAAFTGDILATPPVVSYLMSITDTEYETTLPLLYKISKSTIDVKGEDTKGLQLIVTNEAFGGFCRRLLCLLSSLSPHVKLTALRFLKHFNANLVSIPFDNPFSAEILEIRQNGVDIRISPADFIENLQSVDLIPPIFRDLCEQRVWDHSRRRFALRLLQFLSQNNRFDQISIILAESDCNFQLYAMAFVTICEFEPSFDEVSRVLIVIDDRDRSAIFIQELQHLFGSGFASHQVIKTTTLALIHYIPMKLLDGLSLALLALGILSRLSPDPSLENSEMYSLRFQELDSLPGWFK
jgi:hypothetical protein